MREIRDPQRPGRLLMAERDALMPLLRHTPEEDFARPTACPDWNVRQVLAHCSAALVRIIEGRLEPGVFSPESNAADVAERDDLPLTRLLDELEYSFTEASPAVAARSDGRLDLAALGEWVHAGDVREDLGVPGAYGGESVEEALVLLAAASRRRKTPLVHVALSGREEPVILGVEVEGRAIAQLSAEAPTLIRLCADRPLVSANYELTGATNAELRVFA